MLNPNTEVGGTAFAASIGRTSRQEIWGSIDLIQPLRSPTSCAAKPGTAYGPSNFGIQAKWQSSKLPTHLLTLGSKMLPSSAMSLPVKLSDSLVIEAVPHPVDWTPDRSI